MEKNTTRLQQLHQQLMRKKHLKDRMDQLCEQQIDLIGKVEIMKEALWAEQDDVASLEGRSLARYFYLVVGKLDGKLDQERMEAYAAQVRYDAAVQELAAVNEDLKRAEQEWETLNGCEEEFSRLLQEKEEMLRRKGTSETAELLQLDETIAYLENQLKEIKEAQEAGRKSIVLAEKVLRHLDSAQGLSIWDLTGGGLLVDIMKHQRLDAAQKEIEQLQLQLRRFKTELVDVTIHTKLDVSVDSFLHFADYVFDGLFADWAVLDRIGRSAAQVKTTKNQLHSAMTRLEELGKKTQLEWDRQKEKKESFVVESDT